MSQQSFHTEEIERYLRGEMPAAEAAAFEARLHEDAELAAETEIHRLMRPAMQAYVLEQQQQAARTRSRELLNSHIHSGHKVQPAWRWGIAAAFAILLALGVLFLWNIRKENSTERLKAAQRAKKTEDSLRSLNDKPLYTPAPDSASPGNLPASPEPPALPCDPSVFASLPALPGQQALGADSRLYLERKIFAAYPQQPDSVRLYFERYVQLDAAASADLSIRAGLCYAKLGRYARATALLESIPDAYEAYYDHAQWFLAHIALCAPDKNRARAALRNLMLSENPYRARAASLLRQIER